MDDPGRVYDFAHKWLDEYEQDSLDPSLPGKTLHESYYL